MITQIYLAAVKQASMPEEKLRDFYLYADELQSFVTEHFPWILSESRKYRPCIVGANQFIRQLPESMVSAILGKVGTLASFALGSEDSEILKREFHPIFNVDDLQELPRYNLYLKLSRRLNLYSI